MSVVVVDGVIEVDDSLVIDDGEVGGVHGGLDVESIAVVEVHGGLDVVDRVECVCLVNVVVKYDSRGTAAVMAYPYVSSHIINKALVQNILEFTNYLLFYSGYIFYLDRQKILVPRCPF